MINRLILVIIAVPVAIVAIALAVANRAPTPFTFDPFNPGNPLLTVELPLFVYLFAALVVGMLIGSAATWWRQRRYRKLARERGRQVKELRTLEPEKTKNALTLPGA